MTGMEQEPVDLKNRHWTLRLKVYHGCAAACSHAKTNHVFFCGSGFSQTKLICDKEFADCLQRCVKMSVPPPSVLP